MVVRGRRHLAIGILFASIIGATWGGLSAAATPSGDPSPSATGSGQVGFAVGDTSSPTPTPTPSSTGGGSTGGGSTGGGSTGGGGTGGSGGSSSGGGATPPACVPTTKKPPLNATSASSPGRLRLAANRTAQGSDVIVIGEGFQPGEKVVIAIYPNPVKLGVFAARTTGQLYAQVKMPEKTQLGTHTIGAIGFQDCKVSVATIEIDSPRGSGSSIFPWIVWAVAGGGIGLASLGLILAFLFGWLPKLFAVSIAAGSVT